MPVIVTKRAGSCSACGGRIGKGEYADYTRDTGTKHPECRSEEATQRTNRKPGPCSRCGRALGAGEGLLAHEEKQRQDGSYAHRYAPRCRPACP